VAQEINELIFQPKLSNPVKTLDVPIVSNLSPPEKLELILGFVNVVNGCTDEEATQDSTGEKTIKFLNHCRKISQRINSIEPLSLGLHPIIYFYTRLGRAKIGSFYGVVSLMLYLEEKKLFSKFIKIRKDFEWIIWEYDLIPQIVRSGGALEAREKVKKFYLEIIEKLSSGVDKKNVIKEIFSEKKFGSLKSPSKKETDETQSPNFSRETKSAAYIREALLGCPKCKICGGYLPSRFNTIDHIKRKADGGLGTLDNAQLSHPYCNTTYKN
jgi:HNH endonuclease